MPNTIQNTIQTSNPLMSTADNQKVQALRDIVQVGRTIAQNLQQIAAVLQRMEMKRR